MKDRVVEYGRLEELSAIYLSKLKDNEK